MTSPGDKFRASVEKGHANKADQEKQQRAAAKKSSLDDLNAELNKKATEMPKILDAMGQEAEKNGSYNNQATCFQRVSCKMTTQEITALPGYRAFYDACKEANILVMAIVSDAAKATAAQDGYYYVRIDVDPSRLFSAHDTYIHPAQETAPAAHSPVPQTRQQDAGLTMRFTKDGPEHKVGF